ncbi:MAG: flagellar export chaperone FliS [Candidatus Hydrogenedentota bacterium]
MNQHAITHGTYQKVAVETASQGKLIVMLFNGAVQRTKQAERLLAEGAKPGDIHNNLIRAQEIVAELRSALDLTQGEVAHNLNRIYKYIHDRLIQANLKKDPEIMAECIEHLETMRDTWQEVYELQQEESSFATPAPSSRAPQVQALDLQG